MSRPLLPPRGVFIPTRLIFDLKLPFQVRDTMVQLMALAWYSTEHELPRLSYSQLSALTGKSQSTLHNHFAILKAYHSALRLRVTGDGLIIVSLAGWLYEDAIPPTSRILESGGVKEEDHDQKEEEEEDLPPLLDDHDQDFGQKNAPIGVKTTDFEDFLAENAPDTPEAANADSPGPAADLPRRVKKELIQAGVFSFLLPEVARSGRNSRNLLALLTWCEEDDPEKPGRLFMARLRLGVEVPARYFGKRCPECHRVGKHTDRCSRRYTQWVTG